jgi:hypothetical protein
MLEEHSGTGRFHNLHKFLGLLFTEALDFTSVTDRLGDTVWTTVHLGHNRCQKGGTFWTKLVIFGAMMLVAIYPKGFFHIFLLFRHIVFYFKWPLFW